MKICNFRLLETGENRKGVGGGKGQQRSAWVATISHHCFDGLHFTVSRENRSIIVFITHCEILVAINLYEIRNCSVVWAEIGSKTCIASELNQFPEHVLNKIPVTLSGGGGLARGRY